jgi:ABC-2 type transport system permease protein
VSLLWHQLRAEQLTFWRSREAAIFVFLFPPLLYVLLASVFGDGVEDGRKISSYLVAGLIGYAVANTALAGLAITLVVRRELGLLKRLRSTPLPGSLYLASVLLSHLLIVVLQSLTVIALGMLLFDADAPEQALQFVVTLVIGAACFAGLGLAAAALIRSAEAVAAVVNVIVLPMTFLSGGFGTTDNLPPALEVVADVLPLKYLIELVLATYVDGEPISKHLGAIGVMAAWGAGGYLVARARFGWEPRER